MSRIEMHTMNESILKGEVHTSFLLPSTLVQQFTNTVQHFPDKPSLVFQGNTITYSTLDHWSNQIAQQLIQLGLQPGSLVGVYWPRSAETFAIILGILKAGSGYVPLDNELPADRVTQVLGECKASFLFAPADSTIPHLACQIIQPNAFDSGIPIHPIDHSTPAGIAYIIYTSGTTGKPKGIPITNQQIAHFVQAEQHLLQIKSADTVYQGFSVSFDMWCEETWISFLVGATLVIADSLTAKALDEIPAFLRDNQVTVLHAVPSMLSVIDDDIPSLTTINAGGEACTLAVLNRWATEKRRFFNSYGPTETTVSAAIAQLKRGQPITIGQPLPNYNLAVVNEALQIVPRGTSGELIVSGPGLSHGYIELPALTAEKFVSIPAGMDLPGDRFYRTGDAVTLLPDGTIEFQGRVDDQIKLRGYRIELGEIESRFAELPEVKATAVAVKKDANGIEVLVGYYIPNLGSGETPELHHQFTSALAKGMPNYMIPGMYMALPEFPRLSSGKVDRKKLPLPPALEKSNASSANAQTQPNLSSDAPLKQKVEAALKQIFPGKTISLESDFFEDLSGHSLLAASLVSKLRNEYGLKHCSLRDVYQQRPLQQLINHWETVANEKSTVGANPQETFQPVSKWRYIKCWIAQTLSLPLIYGIFGCQIFFPYLGYYYVQQETKSHFYALLTAFIFFCFIPPLLIFTGVLSKWLLIGKFKEGDYPLWGGYYFRYWFVKTMQELVPIQFLNNTPMYPIYLRLLGANVSKDAQLGSVKIWAEDLITIGKDVSISSDVNLNNVVIENGLMKVRSIHIGDHAYIGTGSVIAGGTSMGAWSELKDISYLPEGTSVKKGEIWGGSPAKLLEWKDEKDLPQPLEVTPQTRLKYSLLYFALLLVFPLALLIPFFPVIYSINELDNNASDYNFTYMLYFPLLTLMYHVLFILFTVMFSKLLVSKLKAGTYPLHSGIFVRKWLTDQLMSLALIVLHPLYATVYIRPFFRALGAKIGKGAEISTASNVTHSLLTIGKEGFIADAVKLGESDVRAQQMHLLPTSIGNNSFVGNSAVIPQGYHLPDNTLIGVLSAPPSAEQLANAKPSDWFGSPAIALPHREASVPFPDHLLTKPSKLRYMARALTELVRIVIPETVVLCLSVLLIAYGHGLLLDTKWWQFLIFFPLYYLAYIGIPAFLITVALKWLLAGRSKPKQMPIWTFGVWASEAVTIIYEALAVPFLLNFLKGTPWLPLLFRMLGVKTGKRVYMNSTDITEFDRVTLEDDVALNFDCGPQTHLFEDRVMKIGDVHIGQRSSIGSMSIILYNSKIESDVVIKPLSLVMKGETLGANTVWSGSPVSQIQ